MRRPKELSELTRQEKCDLEKVMEVLERHARRGTTTTYSELANCLGFVNEYGHHVGKVLGPILDQLCYYNAWHNQPFLSVLCCYKNKNVPNERVFELACQLNKADPNQDFEVFIENETARVHGRWRLF